MNKELITVGVSFFNSELTISRCIESVLTQTYDYFELILIDDGSTDRSNEIVLQYAQDKRIRHFSDAQNRGVAFRHNQIAEFARGKYIAKLDSDDFMSINRLQVQYDFMKRKLDVDIVSSYAFKIDCASEIVNGRMGGKIHKNIYGLLLKNNIIHSSVFARDYFFKDNKYDERFFRCQDLELWLRTVSSYNFELIPEPLVYYLNASNPVKYNQSLIFLRILIDKHKEDLTWFQYVHLRILTELKRLYYKIFYNG